MRGSSLANRPPSRRGLTPNAAMVDTLRAKGGSPAVARSHIRRAKVGGPDRDRTGDLMNAIHARSQLRYWPTCGKKLTLNNNAGLLAFAVKEARHHLGQVLAPQWPHMAPVRHFCSVNSMPFDVDQPRRARRVVQSAQPVATASARQTCRICTASSDPINEIRRARSTVWM